MKIGVTGATGFIGSHLVNKLLESNQDISILSHSNKQKKFMSGAVKVYNGSIENSESLHEFCQHVDIIYHLVGIIAETRTKTFEKTVVQGTQNLVSVAQKFDIKKIVYLSALGTAESAVSKYHQTKFKAEFAIMNSGIPYVILRPSVIYGEGDGFISLLQKMITYSPFTPVIGSGKFELQPIYIDDLISMMVHIKHVENEIISIGGPEKLEYLEILHILKKHLGKKRLNLFLPSMLMKLVATVLEKIIKPAPITKDQILMMEAGSTCDITKMKQIFSIDPIPFENGLQKYLR